MKVLLVKMSSLGDVVHTLPAITDLQKSRPDIELDWLVEEGFVDIAALHPFVKNIFPIAIRRWRNNWLGSIGEIAALRKILRRQQYDLVIDAQGLIKSLLSARLAGAPIAGYDKASIKEPSASFGYRKHYGVSKDQHAVSRTRALFAAAFEYALDELPLDYGVSATDSESNKVMFFHGTTWASKHWPEAYWRELVTLCEAQGLQVVLPSGSDIELAAAKRIAARTGAVCLEPGPLSSLMEEMKHCRGAVSVDTGLGHLATAINLPLVGIYGSTSAVLTGFKGPRQDVLAASGKPCIPCLRKECVFQAPGDAVSPYPPCYESVPADKVLEKLQSMMTRGPSGESRSPGG